MFDGNCEIKSLVLKFKNEVKLLIKKFVPHEIRCVFEMCAFEMVIEMIVFKLYTQLKSEEAKLPFFLRLAFSSTPPAVLPKQRYTSFLCLSTKTNPMELGNSKTFFFPDSSTYDRSIDCVSSLR